MESPEESPTPRPEVHLVSTSPLRGPGIIVVGVLLTLVALPFIVIPEELPIEFDPPFFAYFLLALGVLGIIGGVWMSVGGYDRIEVDGTTATLMRMGRGVRQHDLRQMDGLNDRMGEFRVHFSDGSSFRLNKAWKESAPMIQYLKLILDSSQTDASTPTTDSSAGQDAWLTTPAADRADPVQVQPIIGGKVKLPVDYLTFARCVRCGRPAEVKRPFERSGLLSRWQESLLPEGDALVGVCTRCNRKRRLHGALAATLWVAAIVLVFVIFIGLEDAIIARTGRDAWLALMLGSFLALVFGLGPYLRGIVDYRVLGVKVAKVHAATREVTLRFRDETRAAEVAHTTLETRQGALEGVRHYLRE